MNIELMPAIDLIDSKCVRLTKGNYNTKTIYNEDPVAQAIEFENAGFKRLHVVDLDGAKAGHVVNLDVLRKIAESTRLTIDFGGGIKSDEDIDKIFSAGATLATIGSIAVSHPEQLHNWLNRYGADHIILGADVRKGKICINGWAKESDELLMPFLKRNIDAGVRQVLCTNISKDGTLQGPDIALYQAIIEQFPDLYLIASGGVGSNEDIRQLEQAGIPAVVFGKAWYEGKISFPSTSDT